MDATVILSMIRVFMVAFGGIIIVWGVYDMFSEGQQASGGIKRIVGGIAGIIVSIVIMTYVIQEVEKAQNAASIPSEGGTTLSGMIVPYIQPRLPFDMEW